MALLAVIIYVGQSLLICLCTGVKLVLCDARSLSLAVGAFSPTPYSVESLVQR